MYRYEQIIKKIRPADRAARRQASALIDSLAKPPGSLGKLEKLAVDIAGITGNTFRDSTLPEKTIPSPLSSQSAPDPCGGTLPEKIVQSPPSSQSASDPCGGSLTEKEKLSRFLPQAVSGKDRKELRSSGSPAGKLKKRTIVVMCADNGVCEENVASAPQETTLLLARAMVKGTSGMTVLAREAGSDYHLVDIGINSNEKIPGLIDRRIADGTDNIAKGPAMTREMCCRAIDTGIDIVESLKTEGYRLIGTGELGMGNTSSSACVLIGLTGLLPDMVVGKGAGLTAEAFEHKKEVVRRALAVNSPDRSDPVDVLSKVGGFDIAGLTGVYLGAAYFRIPVVIDGFISAVAALAASRLCPSAADFMIPSHASAEPGFAFAMRELRKEPMLLMDMRLGEGSGCPLAFHLIDAALAMAEGMATFAEASIDETKIVDIRDK